MKKIIFLFAAATLFASSCDKNNDGNDNDPVTVEDGTYVGTVTVSPDSDSPFVKENVAVRITFGDDGTAEIKMEQVKFAEMMPKMDITIPGVTTVETDKAIALSGDGIVPIAMGGEFPVYTITDMEGSVTASELSFDTMFGTFPTSFSGTVVAAE